MVVDVEADKKRIRELHSQAAQEGLTSDITSDVHEFMNHSNQDIRKTAMSVFTNPPKNESEREAINWNWHADWLNAIITDELLPEEDQEHAYTILCNCLIPYAPAELSKYVDTVVEQRPDGHVGTPPSNAVVEIAEHDPMRVEPHQEWAIDLLEDGDDIQQTNACKILENIGDATVISKLKPYTTDVENNDLQYAAKTAIQEIKDREGIDEDEDQTAATENAQSTEKGDTIQFCPGCGSELKQFEDPEYCPSCGRELRN